MAPDVIAMRFAKIPLDLLKESSCQVLSNQSQKWSQSSGYTQDTFCTTIGTTETLKSSQHELLGVSVSHLQNTMIEDLEITSKMEEEPVTPALTPKRGAPYGLSESTTIKEAFEETCQLLRQE
ncbi:hypothetical protein RYX36_016806 [Vicia faba]